MYRANIQKRSVFICKKINSSKFYWWCKFYWKLVAEALGTREIELWLAKIEREVTVLTNLGLKLFFSKLVSY